MIVATDAAQAARTRFARKTPQGAVIWRSDYFGPPPSPIGSASVDPTAVAPDYVDPAPGEVRPPQAFLVEQEPGAVVHAHFHFVDQFQVVVEGDGKIGRHAVAPVTAHFAGAYSGYGPIQPGEAGLKYFTFRASADTTGAQFLPAQRRKLRKVARRDVVAPRLPSTPPAARNTPAIEAAIRQPDGLAVLMLRVPPGGSLAGPDPREGAGQSLLVTAGSIRHDGADLGRLSALFVTSDAPAFVAEAGPEGADVLLLQYPRTAA